MDVQDLGYALTQAVHNLGAVAVTGGAAASRLLRLADPPAAQRRLFGVVLAGWSAQVASGLGFAAISYAGYGHLPDIHGAAIAALLLKMACAGCGLVVSALAVLRSPRWSAPARDRAGAALLALALTALCAAAVLRWFS